MNIVKDSIAAWPRPSPRPRQHPLKKEEFTMTTTTAITATTATEVKAAEPVRTAYDKRLDLIPEAVREACTCVPNSKNTAVHVLLGKTRVFGLSAVIVVNRKEFLGDLSKTAVKKNYGYVLPATADVMTALFQNAVADQNAKAAAKAAVEAEKQAKAEAKVAAKAAAEAAKKEAAAQPAEKPAPKKPAAKKAAKKAAAAK